MADSLLVGGAALDLRNDSRVLPSFQFSDMLQPATIQCDFTHEVTLPGTARNHALLGQAAYDGAGARVPYKSLSPVLLLADGAEIIPQARMYIKGFADNEYRIQLFSGNRRFIEALGEKTLKDLDFSRFTHAWTIDEVASRATAAHWLANGWGYELFDRGKGLDLANVSPFDLYPSVSARLLFEQMVADAGFTATDWQTPLLDKLRLPAVALATLAKAFRDARRLRIGLRTLEESLKGAPSANRNTITETIPFSDTSRPLGNVPIIVPTMPGVFDPATHAFIADKPMYVAAQARTVAHLEIPIASAGAQVFLLVNGKEVAGGEKIVLSKTGYAKPSCSVEKLLLKAGDKLTAQIKLTGEKPGLLGTKWGFEIFKDSIFFIDGQSLPVDKFEVTVAEDLPPGGTVSLADWLPEIKQLDFFKTLVQLGGLRVSVDAYTDTLITSQSADIVGNVNRAFDWSAKRDTPPGPPGTPRNVVFRYGSFGQRNHFRWTEDETVEAGFGDGVLVLNDKNLPPEWDMLRLPFAATTPSAKVPGLLEIRAWKVRENEDGFAATEYDKVQPKPRLVLSSDSVLEITLAEGAQRRTLQMPVSHFSDPAEVLSLDIEAFILPNMWTGLIAMLTDCRALKERYRISPADLAALLAAPNVPIWDSALKGFHSVVKVSEYSATRSVEVEMMRLNPELLSPPAGLTLAAGQEFFEGEFYSGGVGDEWY